MTLPHLGSRVPLVAAALTILVGVPFWGAGTFTGARTFASHDGWINDWAQLQLPFRHICAEALRAGRLPWWTDLAGAGFPLLADGQAGCLYPPNMVALLALPTLPALHVLLLLHQAIAAAGAALLFRRLGVSPTISAGSGVAFAFCAFFVAKARQLNMIETAAWAPWCWLYIEELIRLRALTATDPRRLGAIAALAVVTTFALLAGHPQIAYYHGLVGGIWVIARLIQTRSGGASALRTAASLVLAGGCAAALAAPQLVPTWELTRLTTRVGGMGQAALVQDVPPQAILTWLHPYWFGDPSFGQGLGIPGAYRGIPGRWIAWWEMVAWVGTLPLLAIGAAILSPRARAGDGGATPSAPTAVRPASAGASEPVILCLSAVLALTLIASWGHWVGVADPLMTLVPGYALFRAPGRLSLHTGLAVLALGGLALDRLLRGRRPLLGALALIPLVAEPLIVLWGAQGGRDASVLSQRPTALPPPPAPSAVVGPAPRVHTFDPEAKDWVKAGGAAGGWRGDLQPYSKVLGAAPANLQARWGWGSLDLFTTLMPRAQLALSGATNVVVDGRTVPNLRVLRTWGVSRVLNVENAAISRPPVLERLPVAAPPGEAVEVREMERVEPFVRVLADAHWVREASSDGAQEASRGAALDAGLFAALMEPAHDPGRRTLLHGLLESTTDDAAVAVEAMGGARRFRAPLVSLGTPLSEAPAPGAVTRFADGAGRTELTLDLSRPAWVVLSRLALPGWSATVDGEPRPIWIADGGAMALDLGAGKPTLVLDYEPPGRRVGWVLAALGALTLLALFFIRGAQGGRSTST